MFCIVAFGVLSILGIFSASNRQLSREALDCVFRRVTLRPCNTGFDEKMKARILGTVITRSETAARFLNRNFELLSWTFFVLLLASSIWAVRGVYLFYVTGSCNGLNQTAFCVFDPKGENNQVSATATCKGSPNGGTAELGLNGVNLAGFPVKNADSRNKIVMIGCYGCDYTRKTYPIIRDLVNKTGSSFTFLEFPVKVKTDLMARVGYCVYQKDPGAFWKFADTLFAADKAKLDDEAFASQTVSGLGLDAGQVMACAQETQTKDAVTAQMQQILKTNFYGTPTVFINDGTPLVGPKPYRVYAIMLEGLLYWLK